MTRFACCFVVAFHGALLFALDAPAALYNVTISPREQDAQGDAHYRLWLPDGAEQIRAIIVRQHGCGPGARKLGLEHANDIQWQALAKKWNCALLGSQLWAPEEDCSTWTIPADGSDHAFLTALDKLAEQSGHPEITRAPWCLWGHSGGAMWVMNMTYTHPERIIATFPRSGGLSPAGREYSRSQPAKPSDNAKALGVPILFCFGDNEDREESRFYAGVQGARAAFRYGRQHAAPWCIAVHPKSDHENSNSRLLAIRFFDAMLKRRLPEAKAENDSQVRLKPLDVDHGWLGDAKTFEVQPFGSYPGDKQTANWLVDESFAHAWREFSETGNIRDTSPPPAPQGVTAVKSGNDLTLSWHAVADIESGIAAFRIYDDDKLLAEVRGPVDKRWNPQGNFHAWNYSDQPLLGVELPKMEYRIEGGAADLARLAVSSTNQAGLESDRVSASP